MSEAQQHQQLTMRQRRVAEVIASGEALTVTEAAAMAGVHRNSVHRSLRNEAVQREAERLRAKGTGTALSILHIVKSKTLERLADDPSDQFLLGAGKVAGDWVAQGVEEDATNATSPADYASARKKLMQAVRVGRYLERRSRRCPP